MAIANSSVGFDISTGIDHVVIRNVASANGLGGFTLSGSDFSVKFNVASANGETGFHAGGPSGTNHKFTRNTAVGHSLQTIGVFSPMGTGAIIGNNLFGTFEQPMLERVARCMLRAPVSLSRLRWARGNDAVFYAAKRPRRSRAPTHL